jgi:uncharacterized iron-regulated protein
VLERDLAAALSGLLGGTRVVYVAERHDSAEDHRVQASVVHALAKRGARVVVGLEMVQEHWQPALDAYCAGGVHEVTLEKGLEWDKTWGFAFSMYQPLFEACKLPGVTLLALSPPLPAVRAVARGFAPAWPSTALDSGFEDHRTRVLQALDGHPGAGPGGGSSPHGGLQPDGFYRAQLFRDETMAARMSAALRADPDAIGVVIAGRGHLEYRLGVPGRLDAALQTSGLLIMPVGPEPSDVQLAAQPWKGRESADVWVLVQGRAKGEGNEEAGAQPPMGRAKRKKR